VAAGGRESAGIIERFANCAEMMGRSTYEALGAIFNRHGEVREGKSW